MSNLKDFLKLLESKQNDLIKVQDGLKAIQLSKDIDQLTAAVQRTTMQAKKPQVHQKKKFKN
jgi:hypothetical protein